MNLIISSLKEKIMSKLNGIVKSILSLFKKLFDMCKEVFKNTIGYLLYKPKSLQDYIKVNEYYISKRFIIRMISFVFVTVLGIIFLVIPYCEGKLWFASIDINSYKYHEFTGKAKVFLEDGSLIYKGNIDVGKITGKGQLYKDDILIYEGEFKNEKYNGYGKLYNNKKLVYSGNFENNIYSGYGILYFDNENIEYEGNFLNGIYNGNGNLYSYNTNTLLYSGEFLAGKYNGKGELYFPDTKMLLYSGMFENGKYSGQGTLHDNEKVLYSGGFKDNLYSGEGSLYLSDGKLKYQGGFLESKYSGEGNLYFKNNQLEYSGTFKNGLYNGNGKLYDTGNDISYNGEFENGLKNGYGILYGNNGQPIFTGDFYNNEINYQKFCGKSAEDVRKAFDNENELLMLENSFLLLYDNLNVFFELNYTYDNEESLVTKVKLFGNQVMYGVSNGKLITDIKKSLGDNIFTEYEFVVNEEDIKVFKYIKTDLNIGDKAYSIKYIFDDFYIRAYSKNSLSEVIYFEIGGI